MNIASLGFSPGNKWLYLNEPDGFVEQQVSGTRSIDALIFLDACIDNNFDSEFVVRDASLLTIADRERVLSILYEICYGAKVETTVRCVKCKQSFDIDFVLPELIESLTPNDMIARKEENGIYVFTTGNGISFRLCTGEDELAVMGMSPEQAEEVFFSRCLLQGDIETAKKELPKVMDMVAPMVDTDIDTICPECQTGQKFHFNLQSFFLKSLIRDKRLLTTEIDLLSLHYGWGLDEILHLPRSIRKTYVAYLEAV